MKEKVVPVNITNNTNNTCSILKGVKSDVCDVYGNNFFFDENSMIQLETYKGTKTRYTCPGCRKQHEFTRFIDMETGRYLPEYVGICNRSSNCGYRYTAKQFFADNPQYSERSGCAGIPRKKVKRNYAVTNKNAARGEYETKILIKKPDYIPFEYFKSTLVNYEQNGFVRFLLNLFPDDVETVQDVLKMYFVGTFGDYTCFPQIDRLNRICKAKLVRFNQSTGKRLKGKFDTSSLVARLKKQGKLKVDFQYKQIFFGEHLLSKYPNKPVAIVEAEKTAIIASIYFPEFVWLGSNSKTWLKAERLKQLDKQQIILYPDADGFELWREIAFNAHRQGLDVKVSSLIENNATTEQKEGGYDLADYLINHQHEINKFTENYIAKAESILKDEALFDEFNTILQERIAILEINGNLSRMDAEQIANAPVNIKQIVLNL